VSANGTWVYAQTFDGPGWAMQLPFGSLALIKRPGEIASAAADGSVLFFSRVQADDSVLIWSLNAAGKHPPVASVQWADGAKTSNPVIWLGGLSAAVPPEDFATP
jgi:hypothetical protein